MTTLAGIGLRYPHYQELAFSDKREDVAWLEIHSENFFHLSGMNRLILDSICDKYPVSFHGVGLSLGSADDLDKQHLKQLKTLIDQYQPMLVSEHLSWSRIGGNVINDLLPLPYTDESLNIVVDHISEVQDNLGRQILVENPSSYVQFTCNQMSEYEFMHQVAIRSGCGILLDVNNIYVTHKNHGIDPHAYIKAMDPTTVQEIHLAGHTTRMCGDKNILVDHHGDMVCDEVWKLYEFTLAHCGKIPTLIEWDTNIPSLDVLIDEAQKAERLLELA